MHSILTGLLLSLAWNLDEEIIRRELFSKLLHLLGCRIQSLIDLHESLIELHQLVESANLEFRLVNLHL